MKRILLWFLCIVLLCPCFSAVAEQSTAVITIDGVRTAFFSPDGVYLPPLEKDGLVWVPAVSLGESLGKEISADPDTLAVTLDGVRIAFFAADQSLLMPFLLDGTVYIPLQAFAESAGLNLTVSDQTYALFRDAAVQTPQQPETTPPPYAWVDLTDQNFRSYFNVSFTTDSFSYYSRNVKFSTNGQTVPFQYWDVRINLVCTAKNNWEYKNVSFSVYLDPTSYSKECGCSGASFTNLTMPPNGELTRSVIKEGSYIAYGAYLTSDSLLFEGWPTVSVSSGSIAVPREEMEGKWKTQYESAEKAISEERYLDAFNSFSELKKNQYRDADQQVQKLLPLLYDQAVTNLSGQKYEEAISAFTILSNENYKDSEDLLSRAKEEYKEQQYQEGLRLLEAGSYDQAVSVLKALGNYKDSPARVEEAERLKNEQIEDRNAARYREAEAAESAGDYEQAKTIFTELTNAGYKDSAARLGAVVEKEKESRYLKAAEAMDEKRYADAKTLYDALAEEKYKDSSVRSVIANAHDLMSRGEITKAKKSLEENKNLEEVKPLYQQLLFRTALNVFLPDQDGNVWFESGSGWADKNSTYYLMAKDGTMLLEGLSSAEKSYYSSSGKEYFSKRYKQQYDRSKIDDLSFYQGYALMYVSGDAVAVDRDGNETALPKNLDYKQNAGEGLFCYRENKHYLYGCTDIKGKVVIKPAYTSNFQFTYGLACVRTGNAGNIKDGVINSAGKQIVKPGAYDTCTILSENLILCRKKDKKGNTQVTFLDGKGKQIKNAPQLSGLIYDRNDYLLYSDSSGKKGILDKELNVLLEPSFSVIQNVLSDQLLIGIRDTDNPPTTAFGIPTGDGRYIYNYTTGDMTLYRFDGTPVTEEGKYINMIGDSTSPYIAAYDKQLGWCLIDWDGNLVY